MGEPIGETPALGPWKTFLDRRNKATEVETLPIAIYSMTRKKVSPEIYALSTIMFVVILCIILFSNAMESRNYRRDQKALRGEGV